MIFFKDLASRFIRINAAQARRLALGDPAEAIGKTDADFQRRERAAETFAEEQQLLRSGEPVVDRPEFTPTVTGEARWLATTKVPMHGDDGQVIGLIGISHDITRRMQTEEALRVANERMTGRISQLSGLHELEEQLQACQTSDEAYQVTAHLTSQLLPDHSGALYVINTSRNWVETAITWGVGLASTQIFDLSDCWAIRRVQAHSWERGSASVPCRHVHTDQVERTLCLPLLAQGKAIGVLHLSAPAGAAGRTLDEGQEQFARVVADSVAQALANLALRETLRQQAIRDPLTNLFNRRYMEASLERELLRAARNHQSVSVIMLDVDHFKQVNDRHGHSTGDAVLRQLGRYLNEHIRGGDIACRYGGEEFTLILPETTLAQARQRAEQHRQEFKALTLLGDQHEAGALTISLGVATFPEQGDTAEQVLQAADAALYRAKHNGRNRVEVADALG
jgi:diguanylate cyclase (GGDEF)-like protein/PAS domain S-box-containing protein